MYWHFAIVWVVSAAISCLLLRWLHFLAGQGVVRWERGDSAFALIYSLVFGPLAIPAALAAIGVVCLCNLCDHLTL